MHQHPRTNQNLGGWLNSYCYIATIPLRTTPGSEASIMNKGTV